MLRRARQSPYIKSATQVLTKTSCDWIGSRICREPCVSLSDVLRSSVSDGADVSALQPQYALRHHSRVAASVRTLQCGDDILLETRGGRRSSQSVTCVRRPAS